MAQGDWGYATEVNRPKFRAQAYVPEAVLRKLKEQTPVYLNIDGLPDELSKYNGIYKYVGAYNSKAAWRFGDAIYRDDEGPYIWWSAKDHAWNLSQNYEEVLTQKGHASGGSPLAMLKGTRNHPALQGNTQWHIASAWQDGVGASFVYKTHAAVRCSMSWKEHVDQAEAAGFNKIIVVNKGGDVCYSNNDKYQLTDQEVDSIQNVIEMSGKKCSGLSDELYAFDFAEPFVRVSPSDGTKRYPVGSPQALKQKEWVDAESNGQLWSGKLTQQAGRRRITWRIAVIRLNNFFFVVMQNQWRVERAAMELMRLSNKLLEEGW